MLSPARAMLGIGGVLALVAAVAVASVWKPDVSVELLKPRWAQPPSQFVKLDGMQVHIRDEGMRDDPTPIVLLHGTGADLHTWDGWASQLQAAHRVIRFDRPGFGLTGPNPSGDYTLDYYSGFLERLLDRLGVNGPVILIGNSSGGYMAWRFAVAHPNRIAKLVLISPAGYPGSIVVPAGMKMALNPKMNVITHHILTRSQVRKSLEPIYSDPSKITDEAVDRSYDLSRRRGNRAALGQTMRVSMGEANPDSINQVRVPTLILWGTKDKTIPAFPYADQFHQRIAGSELIMLAGSGHISQEEDPEGTLSAFKQWIASQAD